MSVQVAQTELDPCHVELTIDVPEERVQRAVEREMRRVRKLVTVPGFRAGKAPRHLAERYIDQEQVRERALQELAKEAYQEAVNESDLHPMDATMRIDTAGYQEGSPLSFTVTVLLSGHVHLGQYEGLEATRIVTQVSEADVDREIDRVRELCVRWEPKEGPAAQGDRVRVTVVTTIDAEPVPNFSIEDRTVELGTNLPVLEAGIVGLRAGEHREHMFTCPGEVPRADWPGKEAHSDVTVYEVFKPIVPELDDAFARRAGADSVAEMRQRIRDSLEAEARQLGATELRRELLRKVIGNTTIHISEEQVNHRVAVRTAEFVQILQRRGLSLEDYLNQQKLTLRDLERRLAGESRQLLGQTLVLREIAREQGIHVEEAEVDGELRERARLEKLDGKQSRRLLHDDQARNETRVALLVSKVLEHLEKTARIEEKTA